MLDEGFMAKVRSVTMKREREEMYVAGKIVRNSGQSRKKKWSFSWKGRARICGIEQSGVRMQIGIDV